MAGRSEEHTSELQSPDHLVCRLLLEKKKKQPSPPGVVVKGAPDPFEIISTPPPPKLQPRGTFLVRALPHVPLEFLVFFFFLNDPAPPEIYPLPLHAPLPISRQPNRSPAPGRASRSNRRPARSCRL